jgi:hypothetical protein
MQKKELEEQLKSLQTAIAEKQPSSNVITIMKKLQIEVVPTEELLRVSKLTLCRTPCTQSAIAFITAHSFHSIYSRIPLIHCHSHLEAHPY